MASIEGSKSSGSVHISSSRAEQPVAGIGFDWIIAVLSIWFIGGLYLDGWAHLHVPQLETFFTPWHAVLYSGYGAIVVVLLVTRYRNRPDGYSARSIPLGYELSLVGATIFAAGGGGDIVWHMLFGIEVDLDALLSPTHLVLALGGSLIITGPLRAAWRRRDAGLEGLASKVPMLISLTLLLSVFTFFTQYLHPFGATIAALSYRAMTSDLRYWRQAVGISSVLLQSALLMSLILLTVRRWMLPLGSLTLVIGLNTVLMALMRDIALSTGPFPLMGVALVGGLAADLLVWRLKPSEQRPWAFRTFAFAVPTILYTLYFLALVLTGAGIWWSVPFWTGAVVLAGVVGWLLSYLVIPPASI